ncbi:MAG: hypothetical protein ABJN40_14790 [Sneathiella sp.]
MFSDRLQLCGIITLATVLASGTPLAAPMESASLILTTDRQGHILDTFAGDFNLKFPARKSGADNEEFSMLPPALNEKGYSPFFEDRSYAADDLNRSQTASVPVGFDLIVHAFFTDREVHPQGSLSDDLSHIGREPLETALPLFGLAIAGLGFLGWRRPKDL